MDIESYTDEELGRMVKQAARGKEQEFREKSRTRSGFSKFLHTIGLEWLAKKVLVLLDVAFKGLWALIFG
ncbi:MAG: hypothetical protein H6744_21205 [Deltaproteobacteria bacterium]|nr:hypothetical protein [Deltaproteobacteria bacterium]